jgi:hypothetical protein
MAESASCAGAVTTATGDVMNIKIILVLLCVLVLSGCAGISKAPEQKADADGYYRLKRSAIDQVIVNWAPAECGPAIPEDRTVSNTAYYEIARNYAHFKEEFSVRRKAEQVEYRSDQEFLDMMDVFMKDYIENDLRSSGLNIRYIGGQPLEVDSKLGYQAMGVDDGKIIFVATAIRQFTTITIASLLYPHLGTREFPSQEIPWDCYNKFVNSIKEEKISQNEGDRIKAG